MNFFAEPASFDLSFDYDCNGVIEREHEVVTNCGGLLASCERAPSFLTALPDCGRTGEWGTCKMGLLGLVCENDVVVRDRVMRCR
jgi:hypothetical protein